MSVISKRVQTEIFHGLGAPEPDVGSIPVLFGSKLIKDPQIIYARTNKFPPDPRVIPAVNQQPSLKQESRITGTRQWAVVAVLCYGILDKCQGIYCNGTRIFARKEGGDVDGDLLLDTTNRESNFEDNDFFGEGEPLEGFCFVLPGLPAVVGDLYNRANYLRQWRAKLTAMGKNPDLDNLLTPPDGAIAYNGLALAHIYTFEQSSESLNSWAFYCTRIPQQRWKADKAKIVLLNGEPDTFSATTGGETRARDHVLAIDCSPINGIPISIDSDGTAQSPIRDRRFFRVFMKRHRRPNIHMTYFSRDYYPDISWGIFKYRYDIIRNGAVRALANFKDKLVQSRSRVTFNYTLRVILFTTRGVGFGTPTGPSTYIETMELPPYEDKDGNMVQPITDKNDPKFGLFEGDSADTVTSNNFITEMQIAILNHPWLRPAPSPEDVGRNLNELLPDTQGKKIEAKDLRLSQWRQIFNSNFRSSWYFQKSPDNGNWDRLWVDPVGWDQSNRRRFTRQYPEIVRFIIGGYTGSRIDRLNKQTERICWAPINPFYHPKGEWLRRVNSRSATDWVATFLRFMGLTPKVFPIGAIDNFRYRYLTDDDWVDAIYLGFNPGLGEVIRGRTWVPIQDRFFPFIRQQSNYYVPALQFIKADLYHVFDYVFKLPEFQNQALSKNRLPQLNIIAGPNWPGKLQSLDLPLTGGDWGDNQNDRNRTALVSRFLATVFPTITDLYHMASFNDIKGVGVRPLRRQDNVAWNYTSNRAGSFKDRLKALIERTYPVTPGAPAGDFGMDDKLANLYWETGDRKINWDFTMLDPFIWGSTPKNRFGGGLNVVYANHRVTDYVDNADNEVWDVLDGLHKGNDNPHASDDPEYVPYQPYKAGETNPTHVWPQRGNTWPPIRKTQQEMQKYVLNTVASIDASPEEALGSIGNRMGGIRTKSVTSTIRQYIEGANPAHIIRDCLLNEEWGGGRGEVIRESDLDNASFSTVADVLFEEQMGLGFLWDRKSPIEEFIADVLRHIDGILYESSRTIYLKLFGKREMDNAYGWYRNPVTLEEAEIVEALGNEFNEDNVQAVEDIRVPRESELFNRVVINYAPYGHTTNTNLSLNNDQHIQEYGLKAKTITYDGISDHRVATKILYRDMIIEEAGLFSCSLVVLPEAAADIVPGSLIKLSYAKFQIEALYLRVLSLFRGDTNSNRVKLKCIQAHKGLVVTR